jgi:hypothetical protein
MDTKDTFLVEIAQLANSAFQGPNSLDSFVYDHLDTNEKSSLIPASSRAQDSVPRPREGIEQKGKTDGPR